MKNGNSKAGVRMKLFVGALLSFSVMASVVFAHGGGLDASGGHTNRKTGDYHYHRQPAATTPPASSSQRPTSPSSSTGDSQLEQSGQQETGYWITNSSSKRHNTNCRYYKTSKGRFGKADEGIACKICGG